METKQITENNKLIAEFMGMFLHHLDTSVLIFKTNEGNDTILVKDLKYQTSWDWLMLVVEKIENLEYINREGRFSINSINFEENYTAYVIDGGKGIIQVEGETKIQATYKAVIEFIKWYNLNK